MADVTGKSSGVQRKDTIIIPDIPSSFEGLDVIGYEIGEYMNKGLIGDGYSMRLLLAGDSEGWKNVLKKYGDKYHNFNDYILPFLAESTGSYWGIRENNPDKERYKTWSSKKMASVSRTNKVEFLKALYDTDPNSESAVDLPNSAWEADANVLSFVDRQWKGLAEFISMYQNLIIQEKSKEGQYFEAKDIAKLAEQGHTDGQSIANCPYVVEAMVQNAVATAVNALKSIVFISQGESDNYKMDKKYIDMVKNSARIASATINQYDSDLKSISSGAGKVFDALWSTIPFAGTITKIVEGEVRGLLKAGFGNMMELGGKFSNSDDLKQELADQFDSETNKLYNPENKKIYINPYQLTTIQNAFRLFLNEKS